MPLIVPLIDPLNELPLGCPLRTPPAFDIFATCKAMPQRDRSTSRGVRMRPPTKELWGLD